MLLQHAPLVGTFALARRGLAMRMRATAISVVFAAMPVLAGLSLSGCASPTTGGGAGGDGGGLVGDAEAGQALCADKCAECNGDPGEDNASVAGASDLVDGSAEQIEETMTDGEHQDLEHLTRQDSADLEAFLAQTDGNNNTEDAGNDNTDDTGNDNADAPGNENDDSSGQAARVQPFAAMGSGSGGSWLVSR